MLFGWGGILTNHSHTVNCILLLKVIQSQLYFHNRQNFTNLYFLFKTGNLKCFKLFSFFTFLHEPMVLNCYNSQIFHSWFIKAMYIYTKLSQDSLSSLAITTSQKYKYQIFFKYFRPTIFHYNSSTFLMCPGYSLKLFF